MIYSTEKNIKDLGDKVNAAEKEKAEEAIAQLKQALESGDTEAIKGKTEALKQVSYKIAEEVYAKQQTQAGGAQQDQGSGASQDSGPKTKSAEDVDYEVVDDDKK
jgi:molecular chaperone DnaK